MRVLLYINSLKMGGAERVLVNLAKSMSEQGLDVHLATQTCSTSDAYTVPPEIIRTSLLTGETSRGLFHAARLNLRRVIRLRKLIREWRPDRIIAFMPTANFVAIAASRGYRIPTYVAEHTYPGAVRLGFLRSRAISWAYQKADKLVVLTTETATWYQETLGLRNTAVIPNGVSLPLDKVAPILLPTEVLPQESRVVICVGRLVESKQTKVAMEAFISVAPQNPDWHFVILGDGPLQGELTKLSRGYAYENRIHLVGAVGNIQDWYERSDVLISASRLEGFPTSLVEAMACGCVPIAYDCLTGPRDIIEHKSNGLLVKLDDFDDLTCSLALLLENPEQRAAMSKKAQFILDKFSQASITRRWIQLIDAQA